jgi:hypothetical protein
MTASGTEKAAGRQRTRSEKAAQPPAAPPEAKPTPTEGGRAATLTVPFVGMRLPAPQLSRPRMPHVPVPHVPRPHRADVPVLVGVARSYLPGPKQIAFYGVLGAMAAFQVIEWPVAAAIGAGLALARRGGGREPEAAPARRR